MLEKPSTWEGTHPWPSAMPPKWIPVFAGSIAISSLSCLHALGRQLLCLHQYSCYLKIQIPHYCFQRKSMLPFFLLISWKKPYSHIQESNIHLSTKLFQINYSAWSSYSTVLQKNFFFWYVGQDPVPSVSFSSCKPPLPHDGLFLPVLLSVRTVWRARVGSQVRYSPLKYHALAGAANHRQPRQLPPVASGRWSHAHPSKRKLEE